MIQYQCIRNSVFATLLGLLSQTALSGNNDPTLLPLFQIDSLEYQGAFLVPTSVYGDSQADNVTGEIAYNPINHSIFIAGKTVDGAVGEISIPTLVNSTNIFDLNTGTVLQNFRSVLNATPSGNPQELDRVTGIKLYNGKLLINAVGFYDANADNTHTTLVLEDASDIANSQISGYYELQGAAHIAGWISDIPIEWQAVLQGEYIFGNASNYSINGRYPMGPTAFVADPAALTGTPSGIIPTKVMMDYSLATPLYADYNYLENPNYNVLSTNGIPHFTGHTAEDLNVVPGDNDIWTEESWVGYGFIIPGTRTYLTIGESGGHFSGIGYKARQNGQTSGNCPGPCPYDPDDYYNYYWLWDVNDLLAVKNGSMLPHDVRPYDYGVFNAPFQMNIYENEPRHNPIRGGVFDTASGLLYLTVHGGDSVGRFGTKPLFIAYKVNDADTIFSNDFES